jgi:hypothetical protein
MAKFIRRVAISSAETKHVHRNAENLQLYHNTPLIYNGLLYSTNGVGEDITDQFSSYNTRVGDELYAKGIDLRFWLSNKNDRPNCQYRVIVYKYKAGVAPITDTIFQNFSLGALLPDNNKMIAYADTQNITVIKQFRVGSNGGDYSLESGATNREKSFERKIYIPLKMARIKYATDSTTPKFWDMGVCVVAYDAYGTAFTDNIASFAWSYKLYFKDP